MSLIRKLVKKSKILRYCIFRLKNKTQVGVNTLIASNIHIQNNSVHISEGVDQIIRCADTAYFRNCEILMRGNNNVLEIEKNTEIYGGSGLTFNINGNNNHIIIGSNCRITNSQVHIAGNNNKVLFGDDLSCYGAEFNLRQDGNVISVGEGTSFHGRTGYPVHIVADEGTGIYIGEDCMLSKDIQIRSSDSHSIVDLTGKRLNYAEDVKIGNHVWISLGVTILKGVSVPSHSVVAASAVCTKKYSEENIVIGGNPAGVIKHGIDWDRKLIVNE